MGSIVFENVWKAFGENYAIQDLSFECKSGEYLVLLGPSGAGKTTTINLIAGLERVSSGNILMDGEIVNNKEPRMRDISVAFENYSLYPHINVFENIAFPLRAPIRKSEYTDEQIESKVNEIGKLLQIDELLHRKPSQLSGGQRQRVALARSLVREPNAYLLDEAIAHLDAKLRHKLRGSLKQYAKKNGKTVIYATPDQLEAVAMGDRVLVLDKGVMQQFDEPRMLYDFPVNEFIAKSIGDPQMNVMDVEVVEEKNQIFVKVNNEISIKLHGKVASILKDNNHKGIRMGIRPDEIYLSDDKKGDYNIPLKVLFSETLGLETIVLCKIADNLIKIKQGNNEVLRNAGVAWGKFNEDKLYFFDKTSGKTLWPVKGKK